MGALLPGRLRKRLQLMRSGATRGARAALLLTAALLSVGCGASPDRDAPATPTADTLVDADGRQVALMLPVHRIVSLVPSATLTLDAVGARDALVGRTQFDTAAWAAGIPSVGAGLEPSLEAIVAVHPDLVIRFGGPQDVRTPARLDDLGIPHIAIRPDGIDDVLHTVRLLGRITGHQQAGDSVADAIQATLDRVRESARGSTPVRVAYILGGTPPWVAGPDTYIDQLIRLAGGTNVFSDLGSLYASVSPEEFVAREIDLILVPAGATFDRRLAHGTPVAQVDPALEIPGPGVGQAAEEVASILRSRGEESR